MRSMPGEGLRTIDGHLPPHPNPLPNGERERAECDAAHYTSFASSVISAFSSFDTGQPALALAARS